MDTAEDDEIVLQEVIVERNSKAAPTVVRSDSLQIPGTFAQRAMTGGPSVAMNMLRGLSPKIAPKFPREKLKSMFKKRKLSSAFPFYKLRGVHFSKDTKDDESAHESLLDISYQEPVDVEITLSTPELTETEKLTGVHPYYFTQQTVTATTQMVTGKAFTVKQPPLTRYGSEEDEKQQKLEEVQRSNSLPNISPSGTFAPYIHDPIILISLKKISEAMKNKEKAKKTKRKRKSPPPSKLDLEVDKPHSDTDIADNSRLEGDMESRRNTLPQITLTKCGHKVPEHLSLGTSASTSGHSSSRSSGSGTVVETKVQDVKCQSESSRTTPKTCVTTRDNKSRKDDEPHSTSDKTIKRTESTKAPVVTKPPGDEIQRTSRFRKSPPPKRPETLVFDTESISKPAKKTSKPAKKIAGIALKSSPSFSGESESVPSSPTSDIPSPTAPGPKSSLIPKEKVRSPSSPKCPPGQQPTPFQTARADTKITICDFPEDAHSDEDHKFDQSITTIPPEPPQRHVPRTTGKIKK